MAGRPLNTYENDFLVRSSVSRIGCDHGFNFRSNRRFHPFARRKRLSGGQCISCRDNVRRSQSIPCPQREPGNRPRPQPNRQAQEWHDTGIAPPPHRPHAGREDSGIEPGSWRRHAFRHQPKAPSPSLHAKPHRDAK